jgi:hypothetical protein
MFFKVVTNVSEEHIAFIIREDVNSFLITVFNLWG